MLPDPAEVRLHFTTVPASGFDELLPSYADAITDAELAAARRFVFEKHRILHAASHAFLRRTLAGYLGEEPKRIELVETANGKPELRDRSLRFNLSHTGGLALVGVVAEADLGVDAERLDGRHDQQALARRVFTDFEREAWDGSAEGFFDRWTLKEAFLKARGDGLRLDLRRFGFADLTRPELRCEAGLDDPLEWQFHSFAPTPEHRAAAAVRVRRPALVRWIAKEES